MSILAIDPAARTGFCHSNGHRGVWNLGTGAIRLQCLDELLVAALAQWPTDIIAYESASFGSHNHHVKSRHNQLAAVVELVAVRERKQCWSFNPMQWKAIALGKGNLDKAGVMRLLRIIHGIEETDPDIADALGILKCAERGPPPEPIKKQRRAAEKRLTKAQSRLFK